MLYIILDSVIIFYNINLAYSWHQKPWILLTLFFCKKKQFFNMQIRAAKLDECSQHALEGKKGFHGRLKVAVMFLRVMKELLNPLEQIRGKLFSHEKGIILV